MAQNPVTNLNTPPPTGEPVAAKLPLSERWRAWFAALGEVASWTVKGLLTAGSATVTGLLTAGSATVTGLLTAGSAVFTTAMTVPANGKLFAGDAGWTAVTFANAWMNSGGSDFPTAYMRTADGVVYVQGCVKGGVSGTTVFTLPVGYRPRGLISVQCNENGSSSSQLYISSAGVATMFGATANRTFIQISFPADQ